MFGSKQPRTAETVLAKLTKQHSKLLKAGEQFIATADTFAVDQVHPPAIGDGHKARDFEILNSDEQFALAGQAHLRLTTVRTALGMGDEEFTELPDSRTGYLLAHTNQRLFIFDGPGATYLLQAPVEGLWMHPVDHGDGSYTLAFSNGDERVAVSTRRESIEMTNQFIATFPDRRDSPRIVSLTSRPDDIIEF